MLRALGFAPKTRLLLAERAGADEAGGAGARDRGRRRRRAAGAPAHERQAAAGAVDQRLPRRPARRRATSATTTSPARCTRGWRSAAPRRSPRRRSFQAVAARGAVEGDGRRAGRLGRLAADVGALLRRGRRGRAVLARLPPRRRLQLPRRPPPRGLTVDAVAARSGRKTLTSLAGRSNLLDVWRPTSWRREVAPVIGSSTEVQMGITRTKPLAVLGVAASCIALAACGSDSDDSGSTAPPRAARPARRRARRRRRRRQEGRLRPRRRRRHLLHHGPVRDRERGAETGPRGRATQAPERFEAPAQTRRSTRSRRPAPTR